MSSGETLSSAFWRTHWRTLRSPRGWSRIELPAARTMAFRVADTCGLGPRILGNFAGRVPPDGDKTRQNERGDRRNQHPYKEPAVSQRHLDFSTHRAGNHEPQVHQRISEGIVGCLVFAGGDLLHHEEHDAHETEAVAEHLH